MSLERRALVVGGTGVVGSAVVRALCDADVACTFTYHNNRGLADTLAAEAGATARSLDATDTEALAAFCADVGRIDIFIHCAARLDTTPLIELSNDAFDRCHRLNSRSAFILCRDIGRAMMARGGGNILLVGGMDRAQSLPVPVAYAASQGMLAALTMAIAKELGPHGVHINMLALGLLDAGLSLGLSPKLREDFIAFSALRRFGTADEVAQAIVWLALHNRYLNGKVIPINGGL